MNRFRARRKAKDQALAQAEAYANPDALVKQSLSISKSSKKKKKQQVEAPPQFDIATALPDTSDFRTSLMLPNLSARFSMLREQEDPSSKMGRAGDDSVLFPKRASRLNLFAHNPLADIAEMDAIHATYRHHLPDGDRALSFSDPYEGGDGSIMARSKASEGNNLFGGRQKLYRIPHGSTTPRVDADAPSGRMTGRHMYENDVALSMFQQLRQKEREERRSEESDPSDGHRISQTDEPSTSPMTAYSQNRGTTSSTMSGPSNGRSSTAATSVASESPALPQASGSGRSIEPNTSYERNGTANKRLFVATSEQTVASPRSVRDVLEHSMRPRAPSNPKSAPSLSQSKSASNLGGHYARESPVYPNANFRTISPTSPRTAPDILSREAGKFENTQYPTSASHMGMSALATPPQSTGDDRPTYEKIIQPNDRGKATAMGLFNKPQRQYDDQQFAQRQLQMYEGRISPSSTRDGLSRADSRDSPDPSHISGASEPQRPASRKSPKDAHRTPPLRAPDLTPNEARSLSVPADAAAERAREAMAAANTPRKPAAPEPSGISSVRARAQSLIRRQNEELAALEAQGHWADDRVDGAADVRPRSNLTAVKNGAFYDNLESSDNEVEEGRDTHAAARTHQPRKSPLDVHPALRNGMDEFSFGDAFSSNVVPSKSRAAIAENSAASSVTYPTPRSPTVPERRNPDSPTLGPTAASATGLGLSGMIRSHMRNDSDRSSIYRPEAPPSALSNDARVSSVASAQTASTTRTLNPPESVRSNPWEFDELSHAHDAPRTVESPREATFTMSQKAQQILGQATALKNQHRTKQQEILGDEAPTGREKKSAASLRSWQDEAIRRHSRGGSSETQKERDDFNNELAERRRRIQESLKTGGDIDPWSGRPVRLPGATPTLQEAPRGAKPGANRNLVGRPGEASSKAMRMLGIASPPPTTVSPKSDQEAAWKEEDERMLVDVDSRRHNRDDFDPAYGRSKSTSRPGAQGDEFQTSATPSSSARQSRDRANSEHSARSKSRNGGYADGPDERRMGRHSERNRSGKSSNESEYDMPGAFPPTPQGVSPSPPDAHGGPSEHQLLYDRSGVTMAGRAWPDSRSAAPGSFDRHPAPRAPLATGPVDIRPPRPSPSPMYGGRNSHSPPNHSRGPPGLSDRKKSVTKQMISEPTFVSSTSSVPLVELQNDGFREHTPSPPVPSMNPRRRRQMTTQTLFHTFSNGKSTGGGGGDFGGRPEISGPLPAGSPDTMGFAHPHAQGMPLAMENHSHFYDDGDVNRARPRQRNRLRKISSEGGSIAAKARKQAFLRDERSAERSPAPPMNLVAHPYQHPPPVFPNRSDGRLPLGNQEGNMF